MAGVNKVILIGNLGKDPEVRVLENGTKVCSFSMATSESYKDRNSGETITRTEWHNIVMWRGLADIAERYLKKGNQIYVEGKLQTRSYQDKEGVQKYMTEIVANEMTMLGGKPSSDSSGGNSGEASEYSDSPKPQRAEPKPQRAETEPTADQGEEDDLPF